MATRSSKSVRIRNITTDTTEDRFNSNCMRLSNPDSDKKSKFPWKKHKAALPYSSIATFKASFARQNDNYIATITFETSDAKTNALKISPPDDWMFDDVFDGVTMLQSPQDVEIDICTVHGLCGNGFDTWTAQNSAMWPRDFLPTASSFKKTRIMTFGYSSQKRDKANMSGVLDWADSLLAQVGAVRNTAAEQTRPIIFVCHSLGGLVCREAMIRLNAHPEKYTGVEIDKCGLLFLGTPHSGTVQADWNTFVEGLLAVGGVRTDIIADLKSFNGFGVESKEAFDSIENKPPYFCLCETRKVKIAGSLRHVVTKDSAGLNNIVAFPMPDVNHNEMCKFEHKFAPGYLILMERLDRLRSALLSPNIQPLGLSSTEKSVEAPGHPPVTAQRYPLPPGKKYYEGRGLLTKERLIGRTVEYHKLDEMTSQLLDKDAGYTAVALSGIGGIGKTELLLTLACRHRDQSNIFFLNAKDAASLEQAYLLIANGIGSDLLTNRYPDQDLYSLWRRLSDSEKIETFKRWLCAPENGDNFLIFDDIDSLPQSAIVDAFPQGAQNILLSTRNPTLITALSNERDMNFHHLNVTGMNPEEMELFIARAFKKMTSDDIDGEAIWTDDQVHEISQLAAGHPLVAARTVSYILTNLVEEYGEVAVEEFVKATKNAVPEQRHALLFHKPPLQKSILENFEVSRMRLSDPNGHAWILMKIIAFLSLENGSFHKFLFLKRPWIGELKDHLNYYMIWSERHDLRKWMSELVQVSFGSRKSIGDVLQFHPILIQCIREQVKHDEMIRITRDILLLAYESCQRIDSLPAEIWDSSSEMLHQQARHCQDLCDECNISREEQNLPKEVYDWFDNVAGDLTSGAKTQIPNTASEVYKTKEYLLNIQQHCQEAKAVFADLSKNYSNRDANQAGKALLLPILSELKELDQRIQTLSQEDIGRLKDEGIVEKVDDIFNVVIRLAQDPILYSHTVGQMLLEKKLRMLAYFDT